MNTLPKSKLTKKQVKIFGPKKYEENGREYSITAMVRYDDQCGNGHNSFSITGNISDGSCGCIHDDIVKHFPELAPFIKWHLCSSDGPTHYVANTLYHASDKDCWGLRKGERRQLRSGRTGLPIWEAVVLDAEGNAHALPTYKHPWIDSEDKPSDNGNIQYQPHMMIGEGKEANLAHARSSAVWPEATIDDLQDKDKLEARLPGLIEEFKQAVESLGFTF